jgi:arabinogalactan oligomer/maltooligosaccharide transport system substrate-binding protein
VRSVSPFIVALCAAAMLLGAFAGCGGKKAEQKSTEIVIWEQKDPEEQVLLKKQLDTFMAQHPDVVVSTVHFETDQLHSQFQTAALAGGGPDLVATFEKGSVPSLGGHIYAAPDQIGNHLMLIYNKALVKRVPKDSDDWIAMCREQTKDENGDGIPDRYGLVFNYTEPFWLVPFLGGFGGWVMDESNNPTLDTPAMAGALKFLADLRNRYKIIPKECNYELSDTMFKKGSAAFIINGPWSLKAYLKAGLDIGVTPLPVITQTGKSPVPMVSSKGYSINVNVKDEKLPVVKELVRYLTSMQVDREIMTDLLILPSVASLQSDSALTTNEILRGSLEQARLGRPMPVVPEMRAIWDAIRPFYQSVLGGTMKPEEAAAKMQDQAIKKIAEMRG